MSQLHCYLSDDLAEKLRIKAEAAHMPVSRYLSMLVKRDVESAWPSTFFECFGAWQGDQLERPAQGNFEQREDFD